MEHLHCFWSVHLLGEEAPSQPLRLGHDEVETLARGQQPLKQFMVGVVDVLNDLACPGPAAPGVGVLEAVQSCPGDAFRTPDHSLIQTAAIAVSLIAVMPPESTDSTVVV